MKTDTLVEMLARGAGLAARAPAVRRSAPAAAAGLPGDQHSRRRVLKWAGSVLATFGIAQARAGKPAALAEVMADRRSAGSAIGTRRAVALRDVRRIDAAGDAGWLARDLAGRLWHVAENGRTSLVAEGVDPSGMLAVGHGRIAGRGLDGRLWIHDFARPKAAARPSDALLAPQGGLCVLAGAVIAVIEHAGSHVLARFEADSQGRCQPVARSHDAVLPDAAPIVVDLDGRGDGGHIAVLAGPDSQRYAHAVLGDGIEATRLIWLERHSLEALRSMHLDASGVFEDRLLRPWQLPDGRTGLVTVRSGPSGAQLAVVAASRRDSSALEIAAAGPFIGTRNRWLSPASVEPAEAGLWAVHTPHIGGVLHRYRVAGAGLAADRVATGLTNHRLGGRDLDITARMGRSLLLPSQDWQQVRVVDVDQRAVVSSFEVEAPVLQLVTAPGGRAVAVLTQTGLSIYTATS